MRKLTLAEQMRIIESANLCKERNLNFDINQDFSMRYVTNFGKGYSMYEVATLENLHTILVPKDYHICNVLGNMNYTRAYKNNL